MYTNNFSIGFQYKPYSKIEYKWQHKLFINGIKLFTGSKYFHTIVIINELVYDMNVDGLYIYHISKFETDCFHIIKLKEEYCSFLKNTKGFLNSIYKCEYDFKGILFSQLFKFGIHDYNKYFCSELSAKCLAITMNNNFKDYEGINFERYSPKRLFNKIKNSEKFINKFTFS